MSQTIASYYSSALLAQTAYANLNNSMGSTEYEKALAEKGKGNFTSDQAKAFQAQYEVVAQRNESREFRGQYI